MTVRGVCVRATAIAPVVALVRTPVSATGCEADAVASNARLVPYVKASLAASTGLVPAAVVTVTSTVPVPAEGATAVSTNDVPP